MDRNLHLNLRWTSQPTVENAEELILFLHGMNCSPKTVTALIDRIRLQHPKAQLMIPWLPFRWNDFVDLKQLGHELAREVAARVRAGAFRRVVMMGHSAGGVLVQSAYLDLLREAGDVLAGREIRLVLIAPIARGWEITHHLPMMHKLVWLLGLKLSTGLIWFEKLFAFMAGRERRPLWILQLRKGDPFIVGLRLRWMQASGPPPIIYNLLGSADEVVSWRDMVDEVMENESSPVQYREVPFSNHAEIVDVEDHERGEARTAAILAALVEDPKIGQITNITPWDNDPAPVDDQVDRVVFVIHGIRDLGHWTQKIAARCKAAFKQKNPGREIKVETSSYGFFSMLEFLRDSAKREKVQWLMEKYVEARRRFPKAEFSYIGHSNGTYLLAHALAEYPEVTFDRVVFAGSVVSSRYDWQKVLNSGQVKHVLNFTANQDLVVSWFPRIVDICPPLRRAFGKYLGGAGVVPFAEIGNDGAKEAWVKSNDFVKGGHGAAIDEWNWQNLAEFATAAEAKPPGEYPVDRSFYVRTESFLCHRLWGKVITPCILLLLIGLVVGIGILAWLNPVLFWGGPILFTIIMVSLLAAVMSGADSKPFPERKILLSYANGIFIALLGLIAGWLLIGLSSPLLYAFWGPGDCESGPTLSAWLWRQWSEPACGLLNIMYSVTVRDLSAAVYLLGLYRILTKV